MKNTLLPICLFFMAFSLKAQLVIQKDFYILTPKTDTTLFLDGDRNQTIRFDWESAKADQITTSQYTVYFDYKNGTFAPLLSSVASDNFAYDDELNITMGDLHNALTYLYPKFVTGDTIQIDWTVFASGNIGSDVDNRRALNVKTIKVIKGQFNDELLPFTLIKPNPSFGPIDVYQTSNTKVDFQWHKTNCPANCPGTTYTLLIDSSSSDMESDAAFFLSENFITDTMFKVTMGNIVAFMKQMNIGYYDTLTVKWRVTAYNYDATPVEHNCTKDEFATFRRVFPEGMDEIAGLSILQTGANPTNNDFDLRISLEKPQPLKLSILDLQGKTVWESSQNQMLQGANDLSFPTQNLSSGIYLYKVQGIEGSISGKIVVQHSW